MKSNLILALICISLFCSSAKIKETNIIGKWNFLKLEHFDANGTLDQEATDHFTSMSQGGTLTFDKDGTLEIPLYKDCAWYIEEGFLFMRYSASGEWFRDEILKLDDETLKLKSPIDVKEEGSYHIIEYSRSAE